MTNTQAVAAANLPALTGDQLGIGYSLAAARALATKRGTGAYGAALAQRERIAEEARRRGLVIRRSADGETYLCGRPADFAQIQ